MQRLDIKPLIVLIALIHLCVTLLAQEDQPFPYNMSLNQEKVVQSPCCVVLDYRYSDYIDVYYRPDTTCAFAKVRNDVQNDVYLQITIEEKAGLFFFFFFSTILEHCQFYMSDVFIRKEHLIILSRYTSTSMPLYSAPSYSRSVDYHVPNAHGYIYNVLDCSDGWLKVSFIDGSNNRIEGWMPPEYQCSNVYTACMGM